MAESGTKICSESQDLRERRKVVYTGHKEEKWVILRKAALGGFSNSAT